MADFQLIKEQVTIEAVAQSLGLELRAVGAALRGPCPACKTGGPRALVVTPSKGLFYCFSAGAGGDLITLWGHIEKCSLADAGRQIADTFGVEGTSASAPVHRAEGTTPPAAKQQATKAEHAFDPVAFAAKLAFTDEVAALGFTEADAERFGIGFYRGKTYIPIRYQDGSVAGFVGYNVEGLKLPPKWLEQTAPNVVPFGKRSA